METTKHSRTFAAAIFIATILLCGTSFAQYTQTILHTFPISKDGSTVLRNPVFADPSAGALYGTSFGGGAHSAGSFFSLTLTPGHIWHESQLYSFPNTSNSTSSPNPSGAIVRDSAGNFYGLSPFEGHGNCYSAGYPIGCGTIWKISNTSLGWQRTIIYAFTGGADQGGPASLILDSAGNLYGVTNTAEWGTVFELSPSGATWSYKLLYTFTGGADGGAPSAIVLDHAGNLLGSTYAGGIDNQNVCYDYNTNNYGCGVVFELSPSGGTWTESTLYSFLGGNDGGQPSGTLALDPSGNLFGIAADGANSAGVVFEVSKTSGSWTETVPYAFTYPASPSPGVSSDAAGNIYGGTQFGGLLNTCQNGCGTLFQLSPVSGGYAYNTLYSFTDAFDGASPYQPPTIDSLGNLFVPTNSTFASNYGGQFLNVEFELSPAGSGKWHGSVVHDFPGSPDGFNPESSLVRDAAGNLYGTTPGGGAYGWGTVFEVTPSGSASTEKILYSFKGTTDGSLPRAGLALDSAGDLYGVAQFGGSSNCLAGCGTVFKLSPSSGGNWSFSVLHTFKNAQDGSSPTAGVIVDAAGNVYGTSLGGTNTTNCGGRGCGIVFKLTPTSQGEWTPHLIYAFSGSSHTGGIPAYGTIVMDPSGNLYGVTEAGGTSVYGIVYKLSPQPSGPWQETVLYNVAQDEAYSQGTLVLDHAGNLYGTTPGGGTYNYGTVFELSPTGGGLWTKTSLFSFNGGSTGGNLHGGVVLDSAGNVFGVSDAIAFELSPVAGSWQETTLFSFTTFLSPAPAITLAIDPAGNLYGTIPSENTTVQNVVYELTP